VKIDDALIDEYGDYEEQYELMTNRQARRMRKPKLQHVPKKANGQVVAELADATDGLEGGFTTTYKPTRFEVEWLLSSLTSFYDQALMSDVLALVKGGKEANVYRCAMHPSLGAGLLAAKVYRPRKFRQLRNDKMYREGRPILTEDGRIVKKTDSRIMRAVGKNTAFGQQVTHTSWLMYEYTTLQRLYHAGAAVPRPYASNENSILMEYLGDERADAPPLQDVGLEAHEVEPLFDEVMRNVELMLQHDLIHGDLSAYNILYWEGKITLIDFPQVTNSRTNPQAYFILQRDVTRVCQYFARYGLRRNANAITDRLWRRYVAGEEEV
jgi:RIO kinase 1